MGDRNKKNDATERTIAGGIAGFVSRCIVTPFDVVKIRFQTQIEPIIPKPEHAKQTCTASVRQPKYQGLGQALDTIFREEGVAGLWRGSIPGLSLWIAYSAIQFPIYGELRARTEARYGGSQSDAATKSRVAIARLSDGAIAASVATIATYPLDVLRTRYVSQGILANQNSLKSVVTEATSKHGLRALYSGMGVTLLQVGPSMAITFALYETLAQFAKRKGIESPGSIGFASGFLAKLVVYPLDTVKKRLQVRGLHRPAALGASKNYRGTLHCIQSITYREGIRGFFKGVIPSVLKTGLATGTTFYFYEYSLSLLRDFRDDK